MFRVNSDLRFEENLDRPISELMTHKNLVTASEGTTLEEAKKILQKNRIEKLLVVDKKGNLKGLITVKDIQKKAKYPYACKDKHGRLRVGAAIGVGKEALERANELIKSKVDVIIIDTAHGHSQKVLDTIKEFKSAFPKINLIAGNIATAKAAKTMARYGVDAVKVGIGPGSICTTRVVTGVGVLPAEIKVNPGDRVTLKLTSTDVVHGLSVDGNDVEMTAASGQTASVTFVADRPGAYRLHCTVTCGNLHPFMIGKIYVGQNTLLWRGIALGVLLVATGLWKLWK